MMTTKTAKAKAYELLLNKSGNAAEQHYCASEIEVSDAIHDLLFSNGQILNINQ